MIIKRNKIKRKKIKRAKSRINIIINYYLMIILFLFNSNKYKDNINLFNIYSFIKNILYMMANKPI